MSIEEDVGILIIVDFILLLIVGIIHLVFYFYYKQTDFDNIFGTFDSSPLFDFSYSNNCGAKTEYVLQNWKGLKDTQYIDNRGNLQIPETIITDQKDLKIINSKKFCYKEISYKKLLYNDQIRKLEDKYEGIYTKDCGIIDTLNQHLFIKEGEKCPLYDIGIGTPDDLTNYNYIEDSLSNINIYYNKDNYNNPDKKIIGKLTLSEGQPCYREEEKLWRKFISDEAEEGNLKCELEIFGKLTDDRYLYRGNITYNQLYKENLGSKYELFKDKLNNLEVSLYKREFLGIDKTCDEKNTISKEDYTQLKKYQKKGKTCLLVEAIVTIGIPALSIIAIIAAVYKLSYAIGVLFVNLFFALAAFFVCIICQGVFLGKVIYYDLAYSCSDEITNEVLKNENRNTKISILYLAVNLGLDVFIILINVSVYLINKIKDKYKETEYNYPPQPQIYEKNFNNNNINNNYNTPNKPVLNNNINNINQPAREVVVDNKIPTQGEQVNKPVNPANYNKPHPNTNLNPNTNSNQINNLGVPPTVEQGASSNTKF